MAPLFGPHCLSLILLLLAFSQGVAAQAIGSFYFGRGSAVIVHNPAADNFMYSINSAKGFGDMQALEVKIKPKNDTAIACTGYAGGTTSVYGQIYYQSANSSLTQLIFKCLYASGICVNYGEYIISSDLSIPISPNTKISAALFMTNIGYRVTYQDLHGSFRQIAYANSTAGVVTTWADGNLTSNFSVPDGYALSSLYANPTNVTKIRETLFVVDKQEVKVASAVVQNMTNSIRDQKSWVANPSIPALPSFIPSEGHIATVNYTGWDCLFYIDSTSHLQLMRSTDGGINWSLQPQMDTSAWPLADIPNAALSASASRNISDISTYVYYQSGGKIIQAKITDSSWEAAQVIQAPPNGTFISSNNVPSPNSQIDNSNSSAATKIKIGAGTGVGFAVLMVLAILGCYIRRARIAARRVSQIKKEDSIFEIENNASSEFGFVGKAELSGLPTERAELDHDPECRLLHQLQARRLGELRGEVPKELEGDLENNRGELDGEVRVPELDAHLCTCELDGGRKAFCELASPVSELGCGIDAFGNEDDTNIDNFVSDRYVEAEKRTVIVSELPAGSVMSVHSKEMSEKTTELDDAESRNSSFS